MSQLQRTALIHARGPSADCVENNQFRRPRAPQLTRHAAALGPPRAPSSPKNGRHFQLTITDTSLTITRDRQNIDAETALDGIHVLRSTIPDDELGTTGVIGAYKNLAIVEKDFRFLKAIDIDLRPVRHYREDRVRGHVFLCLSMMTRS